MKQERLRKRNTSITQKNIVLLSAAGLALLFVAVDPREASVSGVESTGPAIMSPLQSLSMLPESSSLSSFARAMTPRHSLLPVAWRQNKHNGGEVVHRWLSDYRTGLSPFQKRQVAEALYRESLRHGFEPSLVVALIATESSAFNWSRSHQGAVGLMQLLPMTAEAIVQQPGRFPHGAGDWLPMRVDWRGEETLFNPLINIKLGLRYLAYLHNQFGDLKIALTAYNYGPTRVAEWVETCEPLPLGYANRILGLSEEFNQRALTEST